MKKHTATLLTLVLLIQIAPPVSAKAKGDWNAVKALANNSIAVRTKNGDTRYGLLQSADEAGITVQIAGTEDFTPQEISFRRDEIEKVWSAKLRFGERNIAKGAWIGVGVCVVAGVIAAGIIHARESSDPPVGAGLFPFFGG